MVPVQFPMRLGVSGPAAATVVCWEVVVHPQISTAMRRIIAQRVAFIFIMSG